MTRSEAVLWECLRDRRCAGLKFRRQVPMGWFVADFLCRERGLIVEVDGGVHEETQEYDRMRDGEMHRHTYRVLRFSDARVLQDVQDVIRTIVSAAESRISNHVPPLPLASGRMGEGDKRG
jgi:very-short-patch-repair endonuclease